MIRTVEQVAVEMSEVSHRRGRVTSLDGVIKVNSGMLTKERTRSASKLGAFSFESPEDVPESGRKQNTILVHCLDFQ